jgi:hypothetical protein
MRSSCEPDTGYRIPDTDVIGVLLAAASIALQAPARESVLPITLRADLRQLYRDRNPDTNLWHAGTISWASDSGTRTVPMRLRTRGLYRLRHCDIPPIRLRFDQDSVRGTPFSRARRPKLVTHCMNRGEYEQNLLQEYAIYRVYQLFTPMSFQVRLLKVTYEDSAGAQRPVTRSAFLSEDPERLAGRIGATLIEREGIAQAETDPAHAALVAVFQYFIANTDWSVPGLHNIALLQKDSVVYPVPFDFDWSGAIDAPYAKPAPQLRIRSVRERVYRGTCQDAAVLTPVLARFEQLKDSIAAVYRSIPDLEPRAVDRALRYYDDFYAEIANRPRFLRDIARMCMR